MSEPFPEPTIPASSRTEVFLRYLDYFQARVTDKLEALPAAEWRRTRLPSGWTPLELLKHLAYVELRWLRWGFAGEDVDEPWGDDGPEGRWHVPGSQSAADVREFFLAQCENSRRIAGAAQLQDIAAGGGRFDAQDPPPALSWILFHVLQEYARHAGQLDVVREFADGSVGE